MRISLLAVVAAATMTAAVTGCDPGTSLRGEALTGFVNSEVLGGEVTRDAAFFFDGLAMDPNDCPRVPAGGITFDGEVVDQQVGGVAGGFLIAPYCQDIFYDFVLDDDDTRDGRLDIVSGDDAVSYVGENLVAERRLVAVSDLTVVAGDAFRFRYAPASDIPSNFVALMRDSPEANGLALDAYRSDSGEIVVVFPRDVPTGPHILSVAFGLEIPTVACEGFSSCAITGQHVQEMDIVVLAAN
jgi:hypothetical protein